MGMCLPPFRRRRLPLPSSPASANFVVINIWVEYNTKNKLKISRKKGSLYIP